MRFLPRAAAVVTAPAVAKGEVRVSYGLGDIPPLTTTTHGGIVKFQRMQGIYPNSLRRFNILYMVSSRMPVEAPELACLARLRKARLVWNQNGVAYAGWHGPGWQHTNAPMKKILQAADHVFYQSKFCKMSADRYLGEPRGTWEILYNAVDTGFFTPRTQPGFSDGLVILLGGTQYQWYRIVTAVRVLARVLRTRPEATLIVTGRLSWSPNEAESRQMAQQLIKDHGVADKVSFIGPYSQADAPDILRRCHLLLHTKYNDPCPGLVVEAMACGLPVVYSKSGGVPELVGDEAGIGIPTELDWEKDLPPDADLMAAAVLEVAERRQEFSEQARQRAVEMFDLAPWLERHRAVFESLLS